VRELTEAYAARLMKDAGRSPVADDIESALTWPDIGELSRRAGHRPGIGYVDPADAADEILDEALQPSTTSSAGPASAWHPQRQRLRQASWSGCKTAGKATPKPCWNTPLTMQPSARQYW
jgi:hypothetical protein